MSALPLHRKDRRLRAGAARAVVRAGRAYFGRCDQRNFSVRWAEIGASASPLARVAPQTRETHLWAGVSIPLSGPCRGFSAKLTSLGQTGWEATA